PRHEQPEPDAGPAEPDPGPEARPAAAGWRSEARSAAAGSEPSSGRETDAEPRPGPLVRKASERSKGPCRKAGPLFCLAIRRPGRIKVNKGFKLPLAI